MTKIERTKKLPIIIQNIIGAVFSLIVVINISIFVL